MPVEDHPVHEKVVLAKGTPYGCKDRVYADGYWTHQRKYLEDGRYVMHEVFIKHVMSADCRYDKSLIDERCATCSKKGNGEKYAQRVISPS